MVSKGQQIEIGSLESNFSDGLFLHRSFYVKATLGQQIGGIFDPFVTVVVAGDDEHRDAQFLHHPGQRPVGQGNRFFRRQRAVVKVPGHDDCIDIFFFECLYQVHQVVALVIQHGKIIDDFAEMPISCMQYSHGKVSCPSVSIL